MITLKATARWLAGVSASWSPTLRRSGRRVQHRHGLFGEGHHGIGAGLVNVHLLALENQMRWIVEHS